ncbi:hypothetical protein [Rhizobium sp. Leaf386]|uniref:hypothetical protein n=1 Tax=unclassified Rhizobium TaxID=2613769 RepID=UPI003298FE03
MFDIIASYQNQAPARIDGRRIENCKPRLPILAAANEGRGWPVPQKPKHDDKAQQTQSHSARGNDETGTVVANDIFNHVLYSFETGFSLYLTAFFKPRQAASRIVPASFSNLQSSVHILFGEGIGDIPCELTSMPSMQVLSALPYGW